MSAKVRMATYDGTLPVPSVVGRELPLDHPLRRNVPEQLRDYFDLYVVEIDGRLAGITDEYGTCHWAALHFTKDRVERAVLDGPGVDEDLRGFDPTKEGGGGPCPRCGREMEPWVYAAVCTPCAWDLAGAR
jgi:hypothetical protein